MLNLTPSTPALPPDVRRGYASPFDLSFRNGLRPRFGLCPKIMGQRPNHGPSPKSWGVPAARHSLASHRAAKPEWMESSSASALDFKTVRYLTSGRRSRSG